MPKDGAAATSGPGPTVASASAWAPLANRLFAVLFVAQFVSNVGTSTRCATALRGCATS